MSTSGKKAGQVSSAVIRAALTVIFYTVVVMVFVVGIRSAYAFGYEVFDSGSVAAEPGTDKLFVVEEGMSTAECMDSLEKTGLIRDKTVAMIQEFFYQYDIYPGTYTLNTSMTTKEILQALDEGPAQTATTQLTDSAGPSVQEGTREVIEEDE